MLKNNDSPVFTVDEDINLYDATRLMEENKLRKAL